MKTHNEILNSEDSLKIISEMINKTKINIHQSIFHLLFWGWLILAASLGDLILSNYTAFEYSYLAWLITIPGIFVSLIYGFRNGKRQEIQTYAGKIYMWNWLAFMFVLILLFVMLYDRMYEVGPFILLLAGFPTFLSGIIIRFKPLILGAVSFWVLALLAAFSGPFVAQLAVPLAVIAGYLIPGYMLRKENK